ncbi:MAG TPA: non-homologous end-joining DNA ligase [Trebonia sp.]|jgi:bifunctional non-homologous end joining protein LigD|nr:non-homologous end-joining DNA ligase [Trebonia sp.]
MSDPEWSPLPASVAPMLALPGSPPPGRLAEWAVEMKWDGVRALALIDRGQLRLRSRTGKDITATYPDLAGLGGAVTAAQAVLDGEIVAFADGRPDFEALQPRMHVSSADAAFRLSATIPVSYLAFDVLQVDGVAVISRPYAERRKTLAAIIADGPRWLCPPHFPGPDLDAVRAASVANGLEGVVAKRLDSVYEPGARPGSWLKVKNHLQQEVVVAGWKPGQGNRAGLVGSLLVGVHSAAGLVYAGHVGTGFSDSVLRTLTRRLEALRRPDSPFDGPVPAEYARPAVWVEPRLVVDVEFDRWTRAGRMRAPAYRGLRDDKNPADVVRET